MMRGRRGFTLLEVMVSVGLLGVIMTLIWSTTSQNLRAKDRIETRDLLFHSGDVALRKISDDLVQAFLARNTVVGVPPPAAGAAATTATAPAVTFKTFFIGEDRGDQDALRFTSLSHLRFLKGSKESDECRVAYELVPNPEEPRELDLVRREQAWLDATTDVEGTAFPLVERIQKFNVEYYDDRKDEWGKEWSTEKLDWVDRLPVAVRITIAFADPDDETKSLPLSTAVTLPLSAGPIDSQ
jgi:general secretion pathway protein J